MKRKAAAVFILLSALSACSACPGSRWSRTDDLVADLDCGMTLAEAQELASRYELDWIDRASEPWDQALRQGNTSVNLDFEDGRLVAYEVLWESRFLFTETEGAIDLCAAGVVVLEPLPRGGGDPAPRRPVP
jgi:hypothetical protein